MQNFKPLKEGKFYHVYNRGINGENLFKEERNYWFFLHQYAKYIEPVAQTFAYCLLPNHFHLLIKVKTLEEQLKDKIESPTSTSDSSVKQTTATKAFSHLFNSYAQSINKAYGRTGSLFTTPFKRKQVDNSSYLCSLIAYIHTNPVHHGFTDDFRDYPYSSYHSLLSEKPTKLQRQKLMQWFSSQKNYLDLHQQHVKSLPSEIKPLIIELD